MHGFSFILLGVTDNDGELTYTLSSFDINVNEDSTPVHNTDEIKALIYCFENELVVEAYKPEDILPRAVAMYKSLIK